MQQLYVAVLVAISILAFSKESTGAFTPHPKGTVNATWGTLFRGTTCNNTLRQSLLSATGGGNRQEEIFKLQEQLRKLKKETEQEENVVVDEPQQDDISKISTVVKSGEPQALPSGKGEAMFFTEGDLADQGILEDSEEGSSMIPLIGLGLAAVVGLAAFSQIPVGQEDYQKYSSTAASTRIDLGDLNEARKALGGL